MGSFLNSVIKGPVKQPHFIILYGPDGVGKTTFAASFPKAIFSGSENGLRSLLDMPEEIRPHQFPAPKSLHEFTAQMRELITDAHLYKTFVLDSADWLELSIFDEICKEEGVKNIEQAFGGFGKGYGESLKVWTKLMPYFQAMREKGMNIILIAHSMVKAFNDPFTNSSYDRYQLKLYEKSAAFLREAADCVLFANFKVATQGKENQKHKAFGDGSRLVYTERRPSFDAKNRLGLPFSFPLDFQEFERHANKKSPEKIELFLGQIQEILGILGDTELEKKVNEAVEKNKTNPEQLAVILNRLRAISEERK